MVNVLLVGGVCEFGAVLAKKLRAVGAHVYILDTLAADEIASADPTSDGDTGIESVIGSPQNAPLVRRLIAECEITRLFLLPRQTHAPNGDDAASVARSVLLATTALVEEVRRAHSTTESLPQIVHVAPIGDDRDANDDDAADDDNDATVTGDVAPLTPFKASVLSVEAFLHSYAISYRMDVRLVRMRADAPRIDYERLVREILELSASHPPEPAHIYNLRSRSPSPTATTTTSTATPATRLLVYGARGWIGEQFVELLGRRGIAHVTAALRPGVVADARVRDEILAHAPSHVVCLVGRTHGPGCNNIDYLEGGAEKLKENVRDNCFAPWCLANICSKLDVHFTYLGTGCLYEFTVDGAAHKELDLPNFTGNSYSVVKGFTDRLLQPFANTLNARIRLPFNDDDSPRNLLRKLLTFKEVLDVHNSISYLPDLLPALLSMMLVRTVGTVNLVSPGAISYERMLHIYQEESGKKFDVALVDVNENPHRVRNRAQCILDTTRLESLQPNVLRVEEAVRAASKKLIEAGVASRSSA